MPHYPLDRRLILRGRKNLRDLFVRGSVVRAGDLQIRFRVVNQTRTDAPASALAAFIVPTRIGKAAYRNLRRRWMREAWRLQRHDFLQRLPDGLTLHLGLQWSRSKNSPSPETFDHVCRNLRKGLTKVVEKIVAKHE